MAKRFLTHIDLAGNQLINAAFEKLSTDPTTGNFEGRIYYNTASDTLRLYDGTTWIAVGAITAVNGTTNEVDVSTTNGVVTISLPSTISADITGNAATATNAGHATTAGTATLANSVAANSVALGTDTTGDYVASVSAGSGISVSGTGEGAAVTVTNSDKGSSQNIFKNISDGTTSVVADNNDDTLTIAAGTGVSVTANASTDTLTIANTGVTEISGTTNEISVDVSTGSVTLSLPSEVIFPGTVTLNSDPTQALHAATKQYVDGMAAGLDWHSAVNLLATSNISLTGTSGTLAIDGHAALDDTDDGYRILLKGQTTSSENGIYVYSDDASTYTLSRAADADAYTELVGAAVFVMEGTTYGATAWIQSNHYLTSFSGQSWIQFSGTGTYVAGNGLALTGNSFSIDTSVTVDKSTAQTLTNKTLTNPTVSGLYLSDNTIIVEGTTDSFETTVNFSDPTADRTITFQDATGTVAFTGDITSAINALTTSDIEEGTNLYYTDTRVNTVLSNGAYTRKYSASVGNGSLTSISVTHNLGTRDVQVQVFDNATYDTVECDVVRTNTNTVTVSFAIAPSADAYRVVVIG